MDDNISLGTKEKNSAAFSSVVAAVFLTGFKLVVGILTNSLGILAEAAHSGLDLAAAGMTFFAVRASSQPPDKEHTYGHGKIENISALCETLLLLITCIWIIYEAVQRLIEPVVVDITLWSFLVMGVSIVVDITRSRILYRTAKAYKSQALEADALHFSTDVYSSMVVIFGLFSVWLAQWLESRGYDNIAWLHRADSVAALGVSLIVILVSYRLGKRAVDDLLDRAEAGLVERVERIVKNVPGVSVVKRIRVRQSGPNTFVDVLIDTPRSATFHAAHHTAEIVEQAVESEIANCDVVVHFSPVVEDENSLVEEIQSIVAKHGIQVHGIRLYHLESRVDLEMHVEIAEHMTLQQAHALISKVEHQIEKEIPVIGDIITHIEPIGDQEATRRAIAADMQHLKERINHICLQTDGVLDCHQIKILEDGRQLNLSLHCLLDAKMPVSNAHAVTTSLEAHLREAIPQLARVSIHAEPMTVEGEIENLSGQ